MGATIGGGEDAEALEARPSGDFVDGYLAAMATVNAAFAGAPPHSFFYSFDWIGDGEEEREQSLHAVFQSEPEGMAFDIRQLRDWRGEIADLAKIWLARHLPERLSSHIVQEFVELIDAFIGDQPAEVFKVRPLPPDGAATMTPQIGADHDHILFETAEGRLFLEFASEI